MLSHTRRPFSRASFNLFLFLALLLAACADLILLTSRAGAVVVPNSKTERSFLLNTGPLAQATPTPWPTLTKCPTSRWLAEGVPNDSLGSNHGFTRNGATFGPGVTGQAFSLDGINDYIEVPINVPVMNWPGPLGSFTWEACVNPNDLANRPVVFSKESGLNNRAGLQVNPDGSLCSYMNSNTCAATSLPGVVVTGKFTRVTLLYNGSTNSLVTYANGVPLTTASVVLPYNHSTVSTAFFNIGWSVNGFGNTHFNGRIDDVMFASCVVPPTGCCGPTPTPSPTPTPIP